jgi:hypothetical protein
VEIAAKISFIEIKFLKKVSGSAVAEQNWTDCRQIGTKLYEPEKNPGR